MSKTKLLFLLIIALAANKTSYGMNHLGAHDHHQQNDAEDAEQYRMPNGRNAYDEAYRIGVLQGIATRAAQRIINQKSFGDALKEGGIGGVEICAAKGVQIVFEIAIAKIIEKWQEPSKEELAQLHYEMELVQTIQEIQKGVEKKQQIIAANSPIIATVGNHLATRQRIFEKKLAMDKESLEIMIDEDLEKEMQEKIRYFEKKITREAMQKINEFETQHKTQDAEYETKRKEFQDTVEQDTVTKILEFKQQCQNDFNKQQKELQSLSLQELQKNSPEAQFAELYDEYVALAAATLREQRNLMDGTLIKEVIKNIKKKQAANAA